MFSFRRSSKPARNSAASIDSGDSAMFDKNKELGAGVPTLAGAGAAWTRGFNISSTKTAALNVNGRSSLGNIQPKAAPAPMERKDSDDSLGENLDDTLFEYTSMSGAVNPNIEEEAEDAEKMGLAPISESKEQQGQEQSAPAAAAAPAADGGSSDAVSTAPPSDAAPPTSIEPAAAAAVSNSMTVIPDVSGQVVIAPPLKGKRAAPPPPNMKGIGSPTAKSPLSSSAATADDIAQPAAATLSGE